MVVRARQTPQGPDPVAGGVAGAEPDLREAQHSLAITELVTRRAASGQICFAVALARLVSAGSVVAGRCPLYATACPRPNLDV